MEELISFLESRIADAEQAAAQLKADDRNDEATLDKIRAHIYGIFIPVINAGKKSTSTPEELRAAAEVLCLCAKIAYCEKLLK